ncbi:hypothetical protein ACOSP7_018186 [Xanthoceras sorbifolium]
MGRSSSYFLFRGLFGALTVVGFIWLLLVGTLESGGNKDTTAALKSQSTENLHRMEASGREKYLNRPEMDLDSMSKRRVPNGPDPIHNRRAGNSRRPPGQS